MLFNYVKKYTITADSQCAAYYHTHNIDNTLPLDYNDSTLAQIWNKWVVGKISACKALCHNAPVAQLDRAADYGSAG